MKLLSELLVIDIEEAKIILRALHPWFVEEVKKLKKDDDRTRILEIEKLVNSLRGFIDNVYEN